MLLFLFLLVLPYLITSNNSLIGYGGMASSPHYLATKSAIDILKQGGSAADASIALQATLGLVQPHMSGIGGGSFTLYYNGSNKKVYTLDAREEAPEAYHEYIFCKDEYCFPPNYDDNYTCNCTDDISDYITNKLDYGGLSVGVPGIIHSFYKMHKYFGKLEWNKLFKPAINYAENGFEMSETLYDLISQRIEKLSLTQAGKELYLNSSGTGPKVKPGELFYNKNYGKFMRLIGENRENGLYMFYEGNISESIINASKNGIYNERYGLINKNDMKLYKSIFREPIMTNFDNKYNIYGMNMPSSGSLTVQMSIEILYNTIYKLNNNDFKNINKTLSDYNINSIESLHYLYNTQNIAFSDRNQYMADNDFINNIPINGLINKQYLLNRTLQYMSTNYTPTPIPYGNPYDYNNDTFGQTPSTEHGTANLVIIDKDNNIVTTTTTLNFYFGSGIVVPEYGFLLNNQLTDFNLIPYDIDDNPVANRPQGGKKQRRTALNLFDLNDNQTIGGKRPRSSIAPIIILDINNNKPIFATGINGGSNIIGSVLSILTRFLFNGLDPQSAIDSPRVWGKNDDTILLEPIWFQNSDLPKDLLSRGYNTSKLRTQISGQASAIQIVNGNELLNKYGYNILWGGSDKNRYKTASVMVVCNGVDIIKNDTSGICIKSDDEGDGDKGDKKKLEPWQIAIIVVFSIFAVLLVFGIVYYLYFIKECCKNKDNRKPSTANAEPTDEQDVELISK